MTKVIVRSVVIVALAATLASCATKGPVHPQAPTSGGQAAIRSPGEAMPSPNPIYKVGDPYEVAGVWFYPKEQSDYDATGIASWYGAQFHGRLTANGEVFDRTAITGAHPTLPMPVNVRVTNLENGRSIVVRVNDRGPFMKGRVIDLSEHAADLLGYRAQGTARVRVTYLDRADLYGPGRAPPSQQTPVEIATAVTAAPTSMVAAAALPPVAGAATAPMHAADRLPEPIEQPTFSVVPEVPDGTVVEMEVPAETGIFVQAGAFTSPANAVTVVARLYDLGPRIFPGEKDGHAIYRVRLGPFQAVEQADAALAQVLAYGQSDAQIVVDTLTNVSAM